MTSESFYEYFTNVFYPFLVKKEIPFPVIVFLDGHVSHLTIDLSKFCREKQIELCCFPSHATHILQPLDVAIFSPLKKKWKTLIKNWRIEHEGKDVQKHQVPPLLSKVITENDFVEAIKNGFATTGLYPLDENAVNYSKCVKIDDSNNTSSENDVKNSKSMTHREYLESKIDTEVLQSFKNAKDANIHWETDDKYASLYDMWCKFVEDEVKSKTEVLSSTVPTTSSLSSHDDLIEFSFPEYKVSISNDCKLNMKDT